MGLRFPNPTASYRTARAAYLPRPLYALRPISPAEHRSHPHLWPRRQHGGRPHPRGGWVEGGGVFKIGLAADAALAAGKAVAGHVCGSTAIVADAAHSASDVVLSGVALWSFRAAQVPKDKEHPYGHGKFETLGALGISGMLLITAGAIAWHAVEILQDLLSSSAAIIEHPSMHNQEGIHVGGSHHHGIDLSHPGLALGVTITSISVKEGLYWITKRAGDKKGSGLMKANAWHHRADAVSSIVALVGVGGAILGVPILDPLAGLVVSGMILKAGIESGYESVMELADAGVPLPTLAPIKETILLSEGVRGCHQLRGRKAGSSLYLDAHIEVDPFLSVSAGHDIGECVRGRLHKCHPEIAEIYLHIDPSVSNSSDGKPQSKRSKNGALNKSLSYLRKDAPTSVYCVISARFPQMSIEHVTHHSLQGEFFLQVLVSMPSDMSIRDAISMAKAAEREILKADSNVSEVSIQLRLGSPTQKCFSHELPEKSSGHDKS